jgi:beta-N-acetylhexosaminidase
LLEAASRYQEAKRVVELTVPSWLMILGWVVFATPAAGQYPGGHSLAAPADAPPGGQFQSGMAPGEVLASLSLEEKVAQLFIVYHGPAAFMAEHGFGGTLIFESMVKQPDELRASLNEARRLCRIPLLVAMDQEGGKVNRLRPLPGLEVTPSAREMAGWSPTAIDSALAPVAAALVDLGINLNLAPVVDPATDAGGQLTLMGRRDRAFGTSAEDIAGPAAAFIQAMARAEIGCIAKHFPGYDVAENSDKELAVSSASQQIIDARIEAFAQVMDRALGVMMSSIRFTEVSAAPAVLDPGWVARARCGHHDRLVMTDDLWGGALRAWVSGVREVDPVDYPPDDLRRLVLLAFDAGNDMLMVTFPRKALEMKAVLVEVIGGDPMRQAALDAKALRILQAKADLGLWEP